MKEKVVVGMSGGVDSSVAAYLLKKQGYDVIGVTMQIWQEEDEFVQEENGGCCGLSAVDDARRVAQMIGIPHYVMNFRKDFKDKVIDYFCEEYLNARTPNPCIACNRYVKWESLLKRCLDIGADYIATGHYSQITKLDNGRYALKCSKTQKKDQTYALYNLTQNQLSKTLMPIGAYTKDEVRQIAEEIGLLVANKPFVMNVYRCVDRAQVEKYLKPLTDNLLMGVIDERAEGITVREEDKEFIARVYSYVFIGIMLDWIKDDMKADPKLIVDKLAILMKDSLADALRRFRI